MSRGTHTHLLEKTQVQSTEIGAWEVPPNPRRVDVEINVALCGSEGRVNYTGHRVSTNPKFVDCPKCNQRLAKQAMQARAPDAPKLELVQDKEAKGPFRYKQGWRALLGGEHIAFLGYEDHGWRVYHVGINGEDRTSLAVGYALDEDGSSGRRGVYGITAARYRSKEQALLAAEAFRSAGKLLTLDELKRERAETAARYRDAQLERDRRKAERAKERDDAIEALREILESQSLSNFQRQGVMTAIDRLTPALEEE